MYVCMSVYTYITICRHKYFQVNNKIAKIFGKRLWGDSSGDTKWISQHIFHGRDYIFEEEEKKSPSTYLETFKFSKLSLLGSFHDHYSKNKNTNNNCWTWQQLKGALEYLKWIYRFPVCYKCYFFCHWRPDKCISQSVPFPLHSNVATSLTTIVYTN